MSVKYPNSDRPIRYADIEKLEGTIAYLSARLAETERMAKGAQDRYAAACRDAEAARKQLKSLRVEHETLGIDQSDSRAVGATRVVKLIFEHESSRLGDTRRDGRIEPDQLQVVLGVGADPDLGLVPVLITTDDEHPVVESPVLVDDELQLVVRLSAHSDRDVADDEPRVTAHDSSPSVGAHAGRGGSASQPTEGEGPGAGAGGVMFLKFFDTPDRRRHWSTDQRLKAHADALRTSRDLANHVEGLARAQASGRLLEWFHRYLGLRERNDIALGIFDDNLHAVVHPDADLAAVNESERGPGLQALQVALDERIVSELRSAGFEEDVVRTSQQAIRHVVTVVLGGKVENRAGVVQSDSHDSSPSVGGCSGSTEPTEGGAPGTDVGGASNVGAA